MRVSARRAPGRDTHARRLAAQDCDSGGVPRAALPPLGSLAAAAGELQRLSSSLAQDLVASGWRLAPESRPGLGRPRPRSRPSMRPHAHGRPALCHGRADDWGRGSNHGQSLRRSLRAVRAFSLAAEESLALGFGAAGGGSRGRADGDPLPPSLLRRASPFLQRGGELYLGRQEVVFAADPLTPPLGRCCAGRMAHRPA